MDIESRLSISFYKQIATINEQHKIYIVQHIQTNKIYVKKILDVYNKDVYKYLQLNPIAHTPRIYEVYESDNQLEVIEEYISGETIEQLLGENYSFTNDKIRDIAIMLCTILKELHSCSPSIIHRDIKPSNIIISPSGELYLLDFNAAKYHNDSKSEDTSLLGTKGYAAPEQYGFGVSTTQTDIYAFGMLLKELTSCDSYLKAERKMEFDTIISKCTKLDANERYKDASSILRILCKNDPALNDFAVEYDSWRSYLPPGFQKLSPGNMIISGAGYAFLICLCLTLEVTNTTPAALLVERICCLLMFLSIIFCSANYRNVQSFFPPCRTKNPFLKILSILLLDVLILMAYMTIMILIVSAIS